MIEFRLNPELCSFFTEIHASLLIDGHLRAGPEQFLRPPRLVATALRTKAPAVVPASRCAPDPKPEGRRSTRGKRRKATR